MKKLLESLLELGHRNTLGKNAYLFVHLTQIPELREHKMHSEPLQTDTGDKLDNEFHQLRESLRLGFHEKTYNVLKEAFQRFSQVW